MAHVAEYDSDQRIASDSSPDHFESRPLIPLHGAWTVPGLLTWRHKGQPLLSISFMHTFSYTPGSFLPGETTICSTLVHHPLASPPPSAPDHPGTTRRLARTKLSSLPKLQKGDEWVMVSADWHFKLLGWIEREELVGPGDRRVKYAVGVCEQAMDVGNLRPDPEDIGNINLLRFLYGHFRPAAEILDIWVPAGQEGQQSLVAVVVFHWEYGVRRALDIPNREFFFDGVARTITISRHETRSWYPAPRSRWKWLRAHALNNKKRGVRALLSMDPFLATIQTDWGEYMLERKSSETGCQHYETMPQEYRPHMYYGLEGVELSRLFRTLVIPSNQNIPQLGSTSCLSQAPSKHHDDPEPPQGGFTSQRSTRSSGYGSGRIALQVHSTTHRPSSPEARSTSHPLSHEQDDSTDGDPQRPAKRQKLSDPEDPSEQINVGNILPIASPVRKGNGETKRETLTEILKARTERLLRGLPPSQRSAKHRTVETNDEEGSISLGKRDTDMDIDE